MALQAVSSKWVSGTLFGLAALTWMGCGTTSAKKGSYRVLGRTYTPVSNVQGYSETGTASWYGPDFHGKRTSSGEVYDMYARTSAHKLLPLGTTVRITNLENGLSTTARVNDRGPFVEGRIIDLSYTLACDLDLAERGTARVQVEAVAGPEAAPLPGRVLSGPFAWQVAAFTVKSSAEALSDALRARFGEVTIEVYERGDVTFYRVRLGSYPTIAAAQQPRRSLEARGLSPFLVRRD